MPEAGYYVLLLIAAIITFALRSRSLIKKKPALPSFGYKLFYSDQKSGTRMENVIYSKLLLSETYELSGKPDFIFKKNGSNMLLPVELKSGKIGNALKPHKGDLMQLCAYFLIIEDLFGIRPKYGRLIYKDHMFVVRNSGALRKHLIEVLRQMRDCLKEEAIELDHDGSNFIKCKHCICRGTVCEL